MVSTRAADYLDKNTNAAIGGEDNGGGSRRGMSIWLARLLPGWPVIPLPGNDEEEAIIAAAIDYIASLKFNGDDNNGNDGNEDGINDGNNGSGIGAGGGGTTWDK
jgi:hypothetical protein